MTMISALFIASSAWQIVPSVFAFRGATADRFTPDAAGRACAEGVSHLAGALSRAAASAAAASGGVRDDEEAVAVLRAGERPEWDHAAAVGATCSTSAYGLDTWAALQRLRTAYETALRSSRGELQPLERDLAARLPTDLR
jgi:hypothetical protein